MDIIRNSVWLSQGTDLLAEGLYRVLDFDRKVDLLILFKIKSERTGKPIPFSFSMFKYYIESNSITCKDYIYPSYMLVDEKELTDKDRGRQDENYNIIKDLVDDRMFLFDYALHKKSHLLMDYSRNKKYHNILSERFWRCIGDMGRIFMHCYPHSRTVAPLGKVESNMKLNLGIPKKTEHYLINDHVFSFLMKEI